MTDTIEMGRRGFLKTVAAMTAIAMLPPIAKKAHAAIITKSGTDYPMLTEKELWAKAPRQWKFPLWASAAWV